MMAWTALLRQEEGAQEGQQGQQTPEEWEPEGDGEEAGQAEQQGLRAWPVAAGRLLELNCSTDLPPATRAAGTGGVAGRSREAPRAKRQHCSVLGSCRRVDKRSSNENGLYELNLTTATERAPTRGRPKVTGSWGF